MKQTDNNNSLNQLAYSYMYNTKSNNFIHQIRFRLIALIK